MTFYPDQRNVQQMVHSNASDKEDNEELQVLGYTPTFRREFSNLATISFAFSILGLCFSVAITFNTPLLLGGPTSVTWCWFIGAINSFTLASSIAEVVSAYPTCGGIYGACARLSPKKYRPTVGWIVGWLNLLGLIVGLTSTESGLANMILAAVSISTNGTYATTSGRVVGLTIGLLVIHGILNSLRTRYLAHFTIPFMFITLGATFLIIILLLAMTPRSDMHATSYVFGADGLINGTGGWGSSVSFLLGLLSVEWSLTGYDCTAHICEELHRAAYAAPTAIVISYVGSAVSGWILNIVLVLCSGSFSDLPGVSGSAFLTIMVLRLGFRIAIALWVFVCITAFFAAQTIIQAISRALYAFSRDHGLPDGGFFGRTTSSTQTPLRAVWLTAFLSALPVLLYLVSDVAANAIFAVPAMALNLSYVIPIILRRIFHSHPEVKFKPGPYYMGDGWLGAFVNVWGTLWTIFICVMFSLPTLLPVTVTTMNYAAPVTVGVLAITGFWYMLGAHRHYHGPPSGPSSGPGPELDAEHNVLQKADPGIVEGDA
ncbi:APC amino acid permease [Chiua virens]|nr:APC amino acid permease [Chiua virens]